VNDHEKNIYTAGIIDGEGYIALLPFSNAKTYSPVVKVASVNKELTDFLTKNYGGFIYIREFKKSLNQRKAYCWEIKNIKHVRKFLGQTKDFLLLKKRQAELVIEYCDIPRNKLHPIYKTYDIKAIERMHEIYKDLRKLNRRGRPPAETK